MSRGLWLTGDQIAYIRSELSRGNKSHSEIAANVAHGVDRSVVSRIASGARKKNGVSCECSRCSKCRNRDASERYRAQKRGLTI